MPILGIIAYPASDSKQLRPQKEKIKGKFIACPAESRKRRKEVKAKLFCHFALHLAQGKNQLTIPH